MKNPDPRIFLDLRPLKTTATPAGFMSDWLGTLFPKQEGAQEQARWLRHVATTLAPDNQLVTDDPALLYVLGAGAGNAAMRRQIVCYLLAVEAFTADATRAQGHAVGHDLIAEIHAATAPESAGG